MTEVTTSLQAAADPDNGASFDGPAETPPEGGADSAPAKGESPNINQGASSEGAEGDDNSAAVPGTKPGDPAGVTKRIHLKHRQLMDERRARLAIEAELTKLQQQLPPDTRPDVPDLPEAYDPDFDNKMKVRDSAVNAAAEYDARKKASVEQQQLAQQAQQQEAQLQAQERARGYIQRAAVSGIPENQLQASVETVQAYGGVGQEVSDYLLSDESGPAITKYIAENPEEIETIQKLSPIQAGIHVATVIKPKAVAANKPSDPPSPPDTLDGKGAPPSLDGPEGATYE